MGVSCPAADQSLDNLVAAAQSATTDDTAAMDAILSRFEGMALSIARSLTNDWNLQRDAAQGARLGLVKAVRSHRLGTPGFPAYAKRYMKGAALRTLTAMKSKDLSLDPTDTAFLDGAPREARPDTTLEVADLIAVLTPEQQAMTAAHYIDDVSFAEIARELGVSKPAVSQRFTTIHRALRPVVEATVAA